MPHVKTGRIARGCEATVPNLFGLTGAQSITTPDDHFGREDNTASAETKELVATLRNDTVGKKKKETNGEMSDEYDLDQIITETKG